MTSFYVQVQNALGRAGAIFRAMIPRLAKPSIDGRQVMWTAFGTLWLIALFAAIIAFLDWRARRKDRQSRDHAA